MTLSFDASGHYVPWRERQKEAVDQLEAKILAETAAILQTEADNRSFGEFEVILGPILGHPDATGCSDQWKAKVSADRTAGEIWQWLKAEHGCLPLISSLVDALSECSVHELAHRDGDLWHRKARSGQPPEHYGWSQRDFDYLTAAMGHPVSFKMHLIRVERFRTKYHTKVRGPTKRIVSGLIVIDLEAEACPKSRR